MNDKDDDADGQRVATEVILEIVDLVDKKLKGEKFIAVTPLTYGLGRLIASIVVQLPLHQQTILLPKVIDVMITEVNRLTDDPSWMFFSGRPDT
jgi:uncharacterized membrane protein